MIFILVLNLIIIGLIICAISDNLLKKLLGLVIFQSGVLLFYITLGYVKDGIPPVIQTVAAIYVNPVPQVLMLTAIVVGIATLAVGIAILLRIKQNYNSIENNEILELINKEEEYDK